MGPVKSGDWISLAQGAEAFGVTASAFLARARSADLRTRLGPGARKEVRLTTAFLGRWPPVALHAEPAIAASPAVLPAGSDPKPPFEQLASLADLLCEDLGREAREYAGRDDQQAAGAARCASVVMNNLALLVREAGVQLSQSVEDEANV